MCSYPKTGTTWLQYIIFLLHSQGNPLAAGENIGQYIPFLEMEGAKGLSEAAVAVKTHLPFSMLPKSQQSKYVYIARDPKDVVVSYYYHVLRRKQVYGYQGSLSEFFKLFTRGSVPFGDYFQHLEGFLQHAGDENLLLFTYEMLVEDIRGSIVKLASFLGGAFLETVSNKQVIDRIVFASSFEQMKLDQSRWEAGSGEVNSEIAHVRAGLVGSWKQALTDKEASLLNGKLHQLMKQYPILAERLAARFHKAASERTLPNSSR